MDIAFVALLVIGFALICVVFVKLAKMEQHLMVFILLLGVGLLILSFGIKGIIIKDLKRGKPASFNELTKLK